MRSFSATFATVGVIMLSTMVGMGWAGLAGIALTPISASAPIIILTLAIADPIHILTSLRTAMREGTEKSEAIVEAIRLNFLPVTITSLTTIIGFMALNFLRLTAVLAPRQHHGRRHCRSVALLNHAPAGADADPPLPHREGRGPGPR